MVKRTALLPPFDERFINYGRNKVLWIEHLRYRGFEFSILTNGFAVDIPHPSLFWKWCFTRRSNKAKKYNAESGMNYLSRAFLSEIRQNEPDESRILVC